MHFKIICLSMIVNLLAIMFLWYCFTKVKPEVLKRDMCLGRCNIMFYTAGSLSTRNSLHFCVFRLMCRRLYMNFRNILDSQKTNTLDFGVTRIMIWIQVILYGHVCHFEMIHCLTVHKFCTKKWPTPTALCSKTAQKIFISLAKYYGHIDKLDT